MTKLKLNNIVITQYLLCIFRAENYLFNKCFASYYLYTFLYSYTLTKLQILGYEKYYALIIYSLTCHNLQLGLLVIQNLINNNLQVSFKVHTLLVSNLKICKPKIN